MEARSVIFALFVAVTVVLCSSHQVSARRLFKDRNRQQTTTLDGANEELWAQNWQQDSYQSTELQDLEEIHRLKLSINKLICGSMEEGCGHMDDAEDQSASTDHSAESFANLNPHEYVREY